MSQAAVAELLGVLRTTDGRDLGKESVRLVLQEMIDVEAAVECVGAPGYPHSHARTSERNGASVRQWSRPRRGATSDLRLSAASRD